MPERPGGSHQAGQVLVAVAHGSADPRAAATITDLMAVAAERAAARGLHLPEVRTAYLGHAAPSLPQVMGAVGRAHVTVLPLLLTRGLPQQDGPPPRARRPFLRVPAAAGELRGHAGAAPAAAQRAGAPPGRGGSAGSRRAGAPRGDRGGAGRRGIHRPGGERHHHSAWRRNGRPGPGGSRSARPARPPLLLGSPTPSEAVTGLLRAGARRVLVATYLLAPGFFADRIRVSALAAGAAAVAPALGALPEVAEVFLDRYQEAGTLRRRAA